MDDCQCITFLVSTYYYPVCVCVLVFLRTRIEESWQCWCCILMLFYSRTLAPAASVFCWPYPTLNKIHLILSLTWLAMSNNLQQITTKQCLLCLLLAAWNIIRYCIYKCLKTNGHFRLVIEKSPIENDHSRLFAVYLTGGKLNKDPHIHSFLPGKYQIMHPNKW